jgi:hypothetical protein
MQQGSGARLHASSSSGYLTIDTLSHPALPLLPPPPAGHGAGRPAPRLGQPFPDQHLVNALALRVVDVVQNPAILVSLAWPQLHPHRGPGYFSEPDGGFFVTRLTTFGSVHTKASMPESGADKGIPVQDPDDGNGRAASAVVGAMDGAAAGISHTAAPDKVAPELHPISPSSLSLLISSPCRLWPGLLNFRPSLPNPGTLPQWHPPPAAAFPLFPSLPSRLTGRAAPGMRRC